MPKTNDKNKSKNGGNGKGRKEPTAYLQSPLTRSALRREVKSLAKLEYQPLQRQIKDEKRASGLQQKRIKDWFGQYDESLDESLDRTVSAYETAGAAIDADSMRSADYAEELRQRLAKEGAADAATRGTTYAPDSVAAAANLARIQTADTLGAVNSTQAANAKAYMADKKTIGTRERIEQAFREDARKRSLNQDSRELARDKGSFLTAKTAELEDRERDYALGVQAATGEVASRRNQRKLARMYASNKQAEQERSLQNQLTVTEAQAAAEAADDRRSKKYLDQQDKQSGKSNGGGTPSAKEMRKAMAFIRQRTEEGWSRQRVIDALIVQGGFSPQVSRDALRQLELEGILNPF